MGWLNATEDSMIALGIDDTTATVPAESGALEPLIDEYVRRMGESMQGWLANLLEMDRTIAPTPQPEDSRLYTPVAVDVFRLLGEQMAIVQECTCGVMVFRAAQEVLSIIAEFQRLERGRLEEAVTDIGLESLCAMVRPF